MLEKLNLNKGISDIIFRDIAPQSVGRGYAYVRGGRVKYSNYGKAFATLYLADTEGNCIPGYIFNLENVMTAGKEMKDVIGRIVIIDYVENRFGDVGMTVIINKIEQCVGESKEHYAKYTGNVDNASELMASVAAELSNTLNRKVTLSPEAATATLIDYSSGKVGGLAAHYFGMCQILKALKPIYKEHEYRRLMGMFFLFILVHCSYELRAEDVTEAQLSWDLSVKLHQYSEVLAKATNDGKPGVVLGDGTLGLINYVFHGVESDDVFVRAVSRAHTAYKSCSAEHETYSTLGLSQSGNAGYGKIVRYCDD